MNNNRTCYLRNWPWHRLDCADRGMHGLGEDVLLTFFSNLLIRLSVDHLPLAVQFRRTEDAMSDLFLPYLLHNGDPSPVA